MSRRLSDGALLRRLLAQSRPFWPLVLLVLAVDLLGAPLALLAPYPVQLVVDSVIGDAPPPRLVAALVPGTPGSPRALLVFAALLLIAVAVLQQAQGLLSGLLHTHVGDRMGLRFRALLFRHAQRLSIAYHDARGTSDALVRIQWDAAALQNLAVNGFISLLAAGATLAGMLWVTARIDLPLALIAVGVTPLLYGLTRWYREPLRDRHGEVNDLERSAIAVLHEVLGAVRVVKAFGREEEEHDRFVTRSTARLRAQLRLQLFQGTFDLLVAVTLALGTAAVLLVGAGRVAAGALTLGQLLLVVSYLNQLYGQIRTLSKKTSDIQRSLVSADRAFALLEEEPDVPEAPGAQPVGRVRGQVELRGVAFAYGDGREVLRDVSFTVEPGTRVGIAGPTGAGKTTLVGLLARFHDPLRGAVLLDGADLRTLKVRDLRRQFAFVLQEPVLFATSIAENIAYARPGASEQEIVAAAVAAHADDFIRSLPDGYATPVGERGLRLSGGERQRISIARAFLRDAPILVLDEPTSAVDALTERRIMLALEELMRGRTTFLIAHRLSTLEGCTLRLHLDQGKVAVSSAGSARSA